MLSDFELKIQITERYSGLRGVATMAAGEIVNEPDSSR